MSTKKVSRRKFLKVAGVAATSAAVVSALGIFDKFFSPSVLAATSLVTQASYYVSPSGSDS